VKFCGRFRKLKEIMNLTKSLRLAVCLAFSLALGTTLAKAGMVSYTCDPTVAVSTCNYLNTTIAGYYSSTFANANASIYIAYGTTGLGQSSGFQNFLTYSQYVTALTGNTSQSPVQVAALAALGAYDATPYGTSNVEVSSALATALGFPGMTGIMSDGATSCTAGSAGCYDEIITITNDPTTPLYYDDQGGTEPAGAYDFYAVVQHETDEVLGTSSCIDTGNINPAREDTRGPVTRGIIKTARGVSPKTHSDDGGALSDGCGDGIPSAVDLYRYSAAGALVLDSSLSTTPGAYFSYNGGTTNGANGVAGTPKVYNTLANGDDYADFIGSAPDCGTDLAVQDGTGCPGEDGGLTILNDGGGEINILNAVGYVLVPAAPQPVTAKQMAIDFGNVVDPPKKEELILENVGNTKVAIGTVSITGTYGNPSQFSFHRYCGANLGAGKSCTIAVYYDPDALGVDRAMLTIPTDPGGALNIPLTGKGIKKK
jgi:hypothetical protein